MFRLDASDPQQVANQQIVEADLGIGGRRLLVVSGIAIPGWKTDTGKLERDHAIVKTNVPADAIEQVTATVSLASIANDDTAWTFALDAASVSIDDDGTLILRVDMAVLGEWSALNRFSYQIVATVIRTQVEIWGTVTFSKDFISLKDTTTDAIAARVRVVCNHRREIKVPVEPGQFGGLEVELTPILPGEMLWVRRSGDSFVAQYRIVNPPTNTDLVVAVNRIPTVRDMFVAKGWAFECVTHPGARVRIAAGQSSTRMDFEAKKRRIVR